MTLDLCDLRLHKDGRWPWLLLVPQRPGIEEVFDLSPAEQALLAQEVNHAAGALKRASGATKINIAAIGNIVRQLHVHVIARHDGDANWPGPVWGFGTAEPWTEAARSAFLARLMGEL
ncbi:HIT family protein [Rhizobium sp. YIM 134829]|uniref:HIT family protein n=1 Tax=Rhizobium sp. YIM 134829 TaxID=3390453 RepID=UPI00397D4233